MPRRRERSERNGKSAQDLHRNFKSDKIAGVSGEFLYRKDQRMDRKARLSGKNRVVIYAEGEPIPLNKFKISKAGRRVRAQVVKPGHLKELQRGSIKAFVNNIARKGQTRKKDTAKGNAGTAVRHVAVAQRKGKERLVINEKFSNSIPVMLGSEKRVYGLVEPYIAGDLQDNLRKIVDAAIGGR